MDTLVRSIIENLFIVHTDYGWSTMPYDFKICHNLPFRSSPQNARCNLRYYAHSPVTLCNAMYVAALNRVTYYN